CARIVAQQRENANRVNVLGGLLLGHTVDGAEAKDEVATGDADDSAIGEESGEGVERFAVVGVVEGGGQDELVGDVEVGVAGGKTLAVEINGSRHGESFHAERVAVLILHRPEESEILLKSGVVGV